MRGDTAVFASTSPDWCHVVGEVRADVVMEVVSGGVPVVEACHFYAKQGENKK
jgi:hypothetical protein